MVLWANGKAFDYKSKDLQRPAPARVNKRDDKMALWGNGKAFDYESKDCRFEPCQSQQRNIFLKDIFCFVSAVCLSCDQHLEVAPSTTRYCRFTSTGTVHFDQTSRLWIDR